MVFVHAAKRCFHFRHRSSDTWWVATGNDPCRRMFWRKRKIIKSGGITTRRFSSTVFFVLPMRVMFDPPPLRDRPKLFRSLVSRNLCHQWAITQLFPNVFWIVSSHHGRRRWIASRKRDGQCSERCISGTESKIQHRNWKTKIGETHRGSKFLVKKC